MKILFSPSEAKNNTNSTKNFDKKSFIFSHLFKYRMEVFNMYKDFITSANNDKLAKIFGTKKQDIIDYYKTPHTKGIKPIQRYSGVAFKYIDYENLDKYQQNFIDTNVLIFSNLFGVILAGDDNLPDYKLKQGEKIEGFNIEKFYNEKFSDTLDEYLKDEFILDLRAGFYEKFYKIKKSFVTMKFIKDKKIVSHYSKAYRGLILKQISKENIKNIDDLLKIKFDKLNMIDCINIKNKTEIIYDIIEG
jgi:cytoplasmic iron level regulating protein YaaA (DUF328/UPF0246 family)